jgi:hypothetical protein
MAGVGRLCLAVVGSAFFVSSGVAADGKLTAGDIQKQVIGKTWASKTRSGKPFTVVWKQGGAGVMTIQSMAAPLPATWQLSGDDMCWTVPGEPLECSSVTAQGKSLVFKDAKSGSVNNVYTAR